MLTGIQLCQPICFTSRVRTTAQHCLVEDFDCVCIAQVLILELSAGYKLLNDFSSCLPTGIELIDPGVPSTFIRATA